LPAIYRARRNTFPVIANCFALILQVESQHVFRFFLSLNWFGGYRGHRTKVVDLAGAGQRMVEFLFGVQGKLVCNVQLFRALEYLGIDHVPYDGLVLPG